MYCFSVILCNIRSIHTTYGKLKSIPHQTIQAYFRKIIYHFEEMCLGNNSRFWIVLFTCNYILTQKDEILVLSLETYQGQKIDMLIYHIVLTCSYQWLRTHSYHKLQYLHCDITMVTIIIVNRCLQLIWMIGSCYLVTKVCPQRTWITQLDNSNKDPLQNKRMTMWTYLSVCHCILPRMCICCLTVYRAIIISTADRITVYIKETTVKSPVRNIKNTWLNNTWELLLNIHRQS